MDIYVIKTRFAITTLPKAKWAQRDTYWSPTLKAKGVYPIYLRFYNTYQKGWMNNKVESRLLGEI